MVDLSKSAPAVTPPARDEPFVSALALLWLVRTRRLLRLVWQLSLLALVALFCAAGAAAAWAPSDSAAYRWGADPADTLLDCLVGVGAGLLALILLGLRRPFGQTARVAARLVPVVTRGAEPIVRSDRDAVRGLLPRLRKHTFVGIFNVLAAVGSAVLLALMAVNVWPVWQANHGHGGTEVVIGKTAFITAHTVTHTTRGGSRTDYFLSTPLGRAIAEDRKPHDGQHWIVQHNSFGNARAYLIGGHDYLILLVIAVFAAAILAGCLAWARNSIRTERRLRMQFGHAPLADSISRLVAGARPRLKVAGAGEFTIGQLAPGASATEIVSDPDDAARRLHRRSLLVLGGAAVVLGAVVAGSILLTNVENRTPPSDDRNVTLNYLAGPSWSPSAYVFYSDPTKSTEAVLRDAFEYGGVKDATLRGVHDVHVPAADPKSVTVAYLYLARTEADGAKAVSGGVALQRAIAEDGAPAPAEIGGLPAGWRGVLTNGIGTHPRQATVYGSADGVIVELSLSGGATHPLTETQLRQGVTELVRAIDKRGLAGFDRDTAR